MTNDDTTRQLHAAHKQSHGGTASILSHSGTLASAWLSFAAHFRQRLDVPRRVEVFASVRNAGPELFFNAQQLIILRKSLGAAWRARLDLTCAKPDNQIGNETVLSLARAMADHDAPILRAAHVVGLDRLGNRADLVDLQQQRIAGVLIKRHLDARGVRHEQIVTNDLSAGERRGHLCVRIKVVLIEGIFNGHHRILVYERLVQFNKLLARHFVLPIRCRILEVKVVHLLVFLPKLGRSNVHRKLDLARVTGDIDGLHQKL
mmetsp:Transcript_11197/g.30124  ORF Transcript_11197/g.30124 Transcript_11197/m.30124 type:complete len:261 (-) Transcript_11197:718-1500(-)